MSPAAARSAARVNARRLAAGPRPVAAPARPRRVSGPARRANPRRRAPAGARATPPPIALRLIDAVRALADRRFVDRLLRGRVWIVLVGVGLIGIVFMQVSMLRMNTGISRAVERASVLERETSALRADISQLSSADRIERIAKERGMVEPSSTDSSTRFLDARGVSAA